MSEISFTVNGIEYGRLRRTSNITRCVRRESHVYWYTHTHTHTHTQEASLEHLFRLQEALSLWQMALKANGLSMYILSPAKGTQFLSSVVISQPPGDVHILSLKTSLKIWMAAVHLSEPPGHVLNIEWT